jgi:trans-aconitate methyltransferase
MTDWNSALYMKFENERTRAARDLLCHTVSG